MAVHGGGKTGQSLLPSGTDGQTEPWGAVPAAPHLGGSISSIRAYPTQKRAHECGWASGFNPGSTNHPAQGPGCWLSTLASCPQTMVGDQCLTAQALCARYCRTKASHPRTGARGLGRVASQKLRWEVSFLMPRHDVSTLRDVHETG